MPDQILFEGIAKAIRDNIFENKVVKIEDIKKIIPDRIKDSHKGTYGKVSLLGGALEYSGAIRLSAMALAALKSGAGLSTVAIPRYLVPIVSQNILEVMIYPIESSENEILFDKKNIDGLLEKVDVLTCGMGLGKSNGAHEIIYYIIENFSGKLVLDADALNIVSENIEILNKAKSKIILTPHMMEFKRLYDAAFVGASQQSVGAKLASPHPVGASTASPHVNLVKQFVEKYNVTLLLKGPTTIVGAREFVGDDILSSHVGAKLASPHPVGASTASPHSVGASFTSPKIKLVDRGTPGMSTAGSGDVLSGIITGLLGYIENEFDATVAAAFVNGLAGELAARDEGEISMTASDTVRHIAEAIKMIKG